MKQETYKELYARVLMITDNIPMVLAHLRSALLQARDKGKAGELDAFAEAVGSVLELIANLAGNAEALQGVSCVFQEQLLQAVIAQPHVLPLRDQLGQIYFKAKDLMDHGREEDVKAITEDSTVAILELDKLDQFGT